MTDDVWELREIVRDLRAERAGYESRIEALRGYLRRADAFAAKQEKEVERLRLELARCYRLDPALIPKDEEAS